MLPTRVSDVLQVRAMQPLGASNLGDATLESDDELQTRAMPPFEASNLGDATLEF